MKIEESNLEFKELFHGNIPNKLIYHHSAKEQCSIHDIHKLHLENGLSGFGYHFFVKKDGSICMGRPEIDIGSHTIGYNKNSIGICAEGNFMKEEMSEVQKDSLIELGKHLKDKYGIQNIYGHRELNPTKCPGENYPLNEIKRIVLNLKNKSYINVDASTYALYKGEFPGVNLIIRNYSLDIVKVLAWVNDDTKVSWTFSLDPINENYTRLYKDSNKVITKTGEGNIFSKNSTHKVRIKGYNKNGQVITEKSLILKIPKL